MDVDVLEKCKNRKCPELKKKKDYHYCLYNCLCEDCENNSEGEVCKNCVKKF